MTEKEFDYYDGYLVKMVFSSGKIDTGYVFDIPNEEKQSETEYSFVDHLDVLPFVEAMQKGNKKLAKKYQARIDVADVVSVVHINFEEVIQDIRDDLAKLQIPNDEPLKTRIWAKTAKLIYANFGPQSPLLMDLRKKQENYPKNKFFGTHARRHNQNVIKPYKADFTEFLKIIEVSIDFNSNYSRDIESYNPNDNSSVLNGIPDFTDDKEKMNTVNESKSEYKAKKKKNKEKKTEIRVLIASPGDVKIAREDLLDKLEARFRKVGFEDACGMRLIVDGWEGLPPQVGHPQSLINNQLVKKSDVVVAIFKYVLGTPVIDPDTGEERSESGTAEELMYAIDNTSRDDAPIGMAYFDHKGPALYPESADFKKNLADYERLQEFRHKIKNRIMYKTYAEEKELLEMVCADIYKNIIEKFPKRGKAMRFLN